MKVLLSLLLLLVISQYTYCQIGPARVTATSIGIYNTSNQDIKILLGADSTSLDTFTVLNNSVWYSGFYQHNPIIIKIKTGQTVKAYSVYLGNYYLIFWNKKKKYWDVKKTQKR
jgi:hypothetical protein